MRQWCAITAPQELLQQHRRHTDERSGRGGEQGDNCLLLPFTAASTVTWQLTLPGQVAETLGKLHEAL